MVSHNQEVKYHNKDEKGHSYDSKRQNVSHNYDLLCNNYDLLQFYFNWDTTAIIRLKILKLKLLYGQILSHSPPWQKLKSSVLTE